jgi:hypothetical protein
VEQRTVLGGRAWVNGDVRTLTSAPIKLVLGSNANRRTLIKDTMNWKPQDWIEHASFGIGRVNENRGDRLDIDFINSGSKTILRTTELKPAVSPADFKSPRVKRKSPSPRIKVSV